MDRYAPDAPDAVSNEAMVRYAAYLLATTETGWLTELDISGIAAKYRQSGLAFRDSGAEALLSHRGSCAGPG